MHNDFLYKLPQQSRGKFFKAGMPPDNIHKLFCVHGGFLCFGKLRFQLGGAVFELLLLRLIVSGQLRKPFIRDPSGYAVLIQTLEDGNFSDITDEMEYA